MLDEGVPCYLGAFRREIWDAHDAYDPPTPTSSPTSIWLSLAAAGRDIRVLPDRLARIRVRPDSLSQDPSGIEEFENGFSRHSWQSASTTRSARRRCRRGNDASPAL